MTIANPLDNSVPPADTTRPAPRQVSRMTRRSFAVALQVEQLEDRLTPSGSYVPAGQFNWEQYSPTGELAQLVWEGQELVYRTRAGNTWVDEPVALAPTYSSPEYDTLAEVQKASSSAQLVFSSDGTANVFFLDPVYSAGANAYQTVIQHYERLDNTWQLVESISTPWLSAWGPVNLVAEAGTNDTFHLLFTESYTAATGVGNEGTGILWYATDKTGSWTFDKVANIADPRVTNWFSGARWAPRFLSMAIDSQNDAHVTFTPEFYISGAFSNVYSQLDYATNASGSWVTQTVYTPPTGQGDAGLGASVAISPTGQVAIASYYVNRYSTGSALDSELLYHTQNPDGSWTTTVVANTPDGYAAGDGAKFTGFAPQLYFTPNGQANILFEDEAAQHNPVTYENEVAGQIRVATLKNGEWTTQTIVPQTDPLVNQMLYPVAATYDGKTSYAGLEATVTLDSNNNPVSTAYHLIDADTPAGPATPPPVSTTLAPAAPEPAATATSIATAPGPGVVDGADNTIAAAQPAVTPDAYAVATDAGTMTTVSVYRSDGSLQFAITPFGSTFTGGARVVRADINGDGVPDIIVGSGPGMASRVRIYDGLTGALIFDVDPFEDFTGGVEVAAGDIENNGTNDIVLAPDIGGGPRIQIWSGKTLTKLIPDFYGLPYPDFRGGLRIAVGDINGDGYADVVVAPGAGGGPEITVYSGESFLNGNTPTTLFNDFYIFDASVRTGLYLAVEDVNGDGYGDIVAGSGVGGGPRVRIVSGQALTTGKGTLTLADFFVGSQDDRGGIRVGTTSVNGQPALITGSGDSSDVSIFSAASLASSNRSPIVSFEAYPGLTNGVFVG